MMNPFKIWRHHLANEAHRRYIAAHPTEREAQRAERRLRGPLVGRRANFREWYDFVNAYLPQLEQDRAIKLNLTPPLRDPARIASLKEPITCSMISAYAQSLGAKTLRPPQEWERVIQKHGLTGWSLAGPPILVP